MALHTLASVRPLVIDCIKAGQPVMVHGRAGTGKSDLGRSIAAELFGGRFIDTRAPNHEPQDIAGLPAIDLARGTTRLLPLDSMPNESRDGATGLWAWDEVNRAGRQMQNVLLGLFLDGYAGGYVKPEGWKIMAMGNVAAERAFIEPMDPALKARLAHYYVESRAPEVIAWGEVNGLHPAVLAFLRHAPELLYTEPAKDEFAAANPRAYAMLSKVLHVAARENWAAHAYAKIGSTAADRFAGFLLIWDKLPPIPYIIANPELAPVPAPNEPGLLYALQNALARSADVATFGNIIRYLNRMPREFCIAAVTSAVRRAPELRETGAFVQWSIANQDIAF